MKGIVVSISSIDIQSHRTLTALTLLAQSFNNEYIRVETVMFYLLKDPRIRQWLVDSNNESKVSGFEADILESLESDYQDVIIDRPKIDYRLETAMKLAIAKARSLGIDGTPVEFILQSIIDIDEENYTVTNDLIVKHDLDINVNTNMNGDFYQSPDGSDENEFMNFVTLMNDEVGGDDFISSINTESELMEIQRILLRKSKQSIIVTGQSGVGKTNLIETFIHRIATKQVHDSLENKQVFRLNIPALLSDIKYSGVFEARINLILNVMRENPDYILYIDDIHSLSNIGTQSIDLVSLLKEPMAKNELVIIGATTDHEFDNTIGKNSSFTRRFNRLKLNEPSAESTVEILKNRIAASEKYYGVKIPEKIPAKIVSLTNLYLKNKYNPDKSIDLLDGMLARKKLENKTKLTENDIYTEISKECKIPTDEISRSKMDMLDHLRDTINERIIGQSNAVESIYDTLMVSMANLRKKEKTMGNFLFQGLTSTGKTDTANIIAEVMGIPMLRYDMSAYQEKHTVSKLIGAPPGYIGFSQEGAGNGQLISDIEKNPHCVLLLDEIEKAHPDVLNILLQIMDYGKLSSSGGKDVYFNKVILIMTSNLGAKEATRRSIGFGDIDASEAKIAESIKKFLSPEFRARIDAIVPFKRLSVENLVDITKLQIGYLNDLLEHDNIHLDVDEDVYQHIAEKSIQSELGARNIQHIIGTDITTKLAKIILSDTDKKSKMKNKMTKLVDGKIVVS